MNSVNWALNPGESGLHLIVPSQHQCGDRAKLYGLTDGYEKCAQWRAQLAYILYWP